MRRSRTSRCGRATVCVGHEPIRARPSIVMDHNWDAQSRGAAMNRAVSISSPPITIPLRQLVPWAIFGGLLFMLLIYFVGAEQGATSIFSGMWVHECVHDGRHLL